VNHPFLEESYRPIDSDSTNLFINQEEDFPDFPSFDHQVVNVSKDVSNSSFNAASSLQDFSKPQQESGHFNFDAEGFGRTNEPFYYLKELGSLPQSPDPIIKIQSFTDITTSGVVEEQLFSSHGNTNFEQAIESQSNPYQPFWTGNIVN